MTAQVQLLDQSNNPTGTAANPLAVTGVGGSGALALDASVQGVTTAVQATTAAVATLTATQPTLSSDGSALTRVTNLPTGNQQINASQAVAISYEQFTVLVELLTQIAQECALTNVMLANELRVKEDLGALRQDTNLMQ